MLDQQTDSVDIPLGVLPRHVGIEGPGCSGKTTLIAQLSAQQPQLIPVPEYYELNGRQTFVPQGQPRTKIVQREVLSRLLKLEEQRQSMIRANLIPGRLVVSDRTYFSCVAHDFARGKVEKGIDWHETQRVFSRAGFCVPDLILYLTTPDTVRAQYAGKIGLRRESMTRNPIFVNQYREFFATYVGNRTKVSFVTKAQAKEIICALLGVSGPEPAGGREASGKCVTDNRRTHG